MRITTQRRSLGDLLDLSSSLRQVGPHGLMWWQWLALPALVICAWGLGRLLARLSRGVLRRLAARTTVTWDDALVARLGGPLVLGWTVGTVDFCVGWLDLPGATGAWVDRWVRGGFLAAFFWVLARVVDIGHQVLVQSSWAKGRPSSRSVLPLGARVTKVVVFTLAVVSLLSELGYPVASLVAGLGIGGLALALAAQKTVENLFGTFSISADQPLREGDFVRIDSSMGTVESIGLRSTRIRTLDRTIITIPNGKLADLRIETFAPRDRIRLSCTLSLAYGTTVAQMRQVLGQVEAMLKAWPRVAQDSVSVRLREFGASSLDIEIQAFLETTDYGEFMLFRQEALLGFMGVVEGAGTSLALPARDLRHGQVCRPDAHRPDASAMGKTPPRG
jgi:MscS family membrane protein